MSANKVLLSMFALLFLLFFLTGCTTKEEKAVQTAQGFSIAWQNQNYSGVYNYFTDDLRSMRSENDFILFLKATDPTIANIVYDKVVLQGKDEAYAYFNLNDTYFNGNLKNPFHMIYVKGKWQIDSFKEFFTKDCVVNSCDENNLCSTGSCSKNTQFVCKYDWKSNCCLSNSDCDSSSPYCRDNICNSVECSSNDDCKFSSRNRCLSNHCIECISNAECGSGMLCNDGTCMQCATNNDCPYIRPFCTEEHVCTGCRDDNDCKYGICNNQASCSCEEILDRVMRINFAIDGNEETINAEDNTNGLGSNPSVKDEPLIFTIGGPGPVVYVHKNEPLQIELTISSCSDLSDVSLNLYLINTTRSDDLPNPPYRISYYLDEKYSASDMVNQIKSDTKYIQKYSLDYQRMDCFTEECDSLTEYYYFVVVVTDDKDSKAVYYAKFHIAYI